MKNNYSKEWAEEVFSDASCLSRKPKIKDVKGTGDVKNFDITTEKYKETKVRTETIEYEIKN